VVEAVTTVALVKKQIREDDVCRRTKIVGLLLNAGANLQTDSVRKTGYTFLMEAIENGQPEIVRMLLNRGASVPTQGHEGWKQGGRSDTSALMLCAARTTSHLPPLARATHRRAMGEIFSLVLNANTDVSAIATIDNLVAGAGGNIPGTQTRIRTTTGGSGYGCVVSVIVGGGTAGTVAGIGDITIMSPGVGYNVGDVLTCADLGSGIADVQFSILTVKAVDNVNLQTDFGQTALIFAALKGQSEFIKQLLHAGADINHKDRDKRTPLGIAAAVGSWDAVVSLIDLGADLDEETRERILNFLETPPPERDTYSGPSPPLSIARLRYHAEQRRLRDIISWKRLKELAVSGLI
jgi:hypothetical protein